MNSDNLKSHYFERQIFFTVVFFLQDEANDQQLKHKLCPDLDRSRTYLENFSLHTTRAYRKGYQSAIQDRSKYPDINVTLLRYDMLNTIDNTCIDEHTYLKLESVSQQLGLHVTINHNNNSPSNLSFTPLLS